MKRVLYLFISRNATSETTVQTRLYPYTRSIEIFLQPETHRPYLPNYKISRKDVAQITTSIYNTEKVHEWNGSKESFLAQTIKLTEQFIHSDKIRIKNNLFSQGDLKRRILILLNINKIVQYIWSEIRAENTEELSAVFDKESPVRSTSGMRPWYTSKPCEWTKKSHISHCVYDSDWEANEAYYLDKSDYVESFVKNDHIGFVIFYTFKGVVHKYYPDFIVRLENGKYLVLEVKGQDDQQNKEKRNALEMWVKAVNENGGFGNWNCGVSHHPSDIDGILQRLLK